MYVHCVLGILPAGGGTAMSGPAFGRIGRIQFRTGAGSEIAAAAGRPGRSRHEIAAEDHTGTDLPSITGHAAGQIPIRRHLSHRSGTISCRTLQSGRRGPRSGAQDRYLFAEIARIRLFGPVVGLLGLIHARSGTIPILI